MKNFNQHRRHLARLSLTIPLALSLPAMAENQKPLELFGTTLKGADREQLRQAFKQNGLRAIRENNDYWVDTYNAAGVLEGASEFKAGYVGATNKFAYAEYTFETFMDTELVGRVIKLVSTKYGRPSSQNGNIGLGPVTAKWNMGQGMQIEVSRGWPDTTTLLKFIDTAAQRQMVAEIEAAKVAQTNQKAKAQSKAF